MIGLPSSLGTTHKSVMFEQLVRIIKSVVFKVLIVDCVSENVTPSPTPLPVPLKLKK